MKKLLLTVLVLGFVTTLAPQSVSQAAKGVPPAPPALTDSLGRDTPSGTVLGFLQAAQAGNYKVAAEYLQMSAARRQSIGPTVATKLKVLMDRTFVGNLRTISTHAEGNVTSGTENQQSIGAFGNGETDVPVTLVRVTEDNAKVWLFSAETLSKVSDLYDNVQVHQVERELPQTLVQNLFLGMPLWQWLALLIAIPIAAAIGGIVVLILAVPRRIWLKYKKRAAVTTYSKISVPIVVFFGAIAHRVIGSYLGLPLLPRVYYYRTIGVIITISFFWLVFRATGLTMQRLRARAIRAGRVGTGSLMLLGERLLKVAVIAIAILAVLGILGFNLTTVLAGLGIGGIAIAFAAQKTLENLFGGVSVLADEVIRVGDFCRFGDKVGTVEDISLRSTRIRTNDRSELSIPNGSLATMNIENFARRDKILLNPTIGVRYETTADQLRYLLAEVRRMLYEHPKVESDGTRIRFVSFDNNALTLEIYCYVLTQDWGEFTAIREDMLLRIMDIVEKSGTGFALPARTVYFSRDPGLDKEKATSAERQVQRWREDHQLPFPDFAPGDIAARSNSLPYPPPESAVRGNRR